MLTEKGLAVDSSVEAVAHDVYMVSGPPVYTLGIHFGTHAVMVRLTDGSLWMCGPVPISPSVKKKVDGLGPVRYLVAQTPFHVWRLEEACRIFPDAEPWACPQVSRGFRHLPVRIIGKDRPDWSDELEFLVFEGSPLLKEVIFFHKPSALVIVGDLIQSHTPVEGAAVRNLLMRLMGVSAPKATVPFDIRLSFTRRDLARRSLKKLLAWDFDKVILAHDRYLDRDAKKCVQQAFHWLQH